LPLALPLNRAISLRNMPYRVCKTIDVENGHLLSKHPGRCRYPHGHTRKIEFILEASELDRNEMVCDFKLIDQIIADYLETLDHALCVNTADPAYGKLRALYGDRIVPFEQEDPTTEVMARVIFQVFSKRLGDYARKQQRQYPLRTSVRLVSVKVWETASSWAEYQA
jgi:6-pyruvoyltetrahydropterin/6-carboxytetrahydropterin synthase